ncbi:hypothetical protein KEM54_001377, partial [Ascosphaera aggregata]
ICDRCGQCLHHASSLEKHQQNLTCRKAYFRLQNQGHVRCPDCRKVFEPKSWEEHCKSRRCGDTAQSKTVLPWLIKTHMESEEFIRKNLFTPSRDGPIPVYPEGRKTFQMQPRPRQATSLLELSNRKEAEETPSDQTKPVSSNRCRHVPARPGPRASGFLPITRKPKPKPVVETPKPSIGTLASKETANQKYSQPRSRPAKVESRIQAPVASKNDYPPLRTTKSLSRGNVHMLSRERSADVPQPPSVRYDDSEYQPSSKQGRAVQPAPKTWYEYATELAQQGMIHQIDIQDTQVEGSWASASLNGLRCSFTEDWPPPKRRLATLHLHMARIIGRQPQLLSRWNPNQYPMLWITIILAALVCDFGHIGRGEGPSHGILERFHSRQRQTAIRHQQKNLGSVTSLYLDGTNILGKDNGKLGSDPCLNCHVLLQAVSLLVVMIQPTNSFRARIQTRHPISPFACIGPTKTREEVFEHYWFLRDGKTGLHEFFRIAYNNSEQKTVVTLERWEVLLGISSSGYSLSAHVKEVSDYFTTDTFADSYRDHNVHSMFADWRQMENTET